MTEESRTMEAASTNAESAAKESPKVEAPAQPGHSEEHQESRTQGMLREAIQKVMEEIERHEVDAKRHLQQAESLRRELRDSLAFLQEKGRPVTALGESRASKVEHDTKEKALRGNTKKKPGAGKSK